jgi:hypothetical protein
MDGVAKPGIEHLFSKMVVCLSTTRLYPAGKRRFNRYVEDPYAKEGLKKKHPALER